MPQLQGQFPGANPIIDNPQGANGWTAGGEAIVTLQAQPTITRPWIITGWGIQAKIDMIAQGTGPTYGRLGKLLAAVVVGGSLTPVSAKPFSPPPQGALANMITLWDGSQDPPPPFTTISASTPLPTAGVVTGSSQFPQPQPLSPGDQLAIGIWLTPSILNNINGIFVYNVTYTISYDTST